MGDPGRQRKKFTKPFRPYDKSRIEEEKGLLKEYGLKTKKELWRMEGLVRSFRHRARDLLAESDESKEEALLEHMQSLGLLEKGAKLEDVLSLETKDLLERRLQTLVFRKDIANTANQARQLIVHCHVRMNGRTVKWPSHLVTLDEEGTIASDMKIEPPKSKKEVKEDGGKEKGKAQGKDSEKGSEEKGKAEESGEAGKEETKEGNKA
jgi:small subunit ribosomal protein S4